MVCSFSNKCYILAIVLCTVTIHSEVLHEKFTCHKELFPVTRCSRDFLFRLVTCLLMFQLIKTSYENGNKDTKCATWGWGV